MDVLAIGLSLLISISFALGIFFYILASKAYSYRKIRLKKYPVIGYLTVIIFQGAIVFFLVYRAAGWNHQSIPFLPMIASSLLIGGFYPLTQIYQHKQDLEDGVISISSWLGYKGTFVLTGIVYAFAFMVLGLYFHFHFEIMKFVILQMCLLPVIIYFFIWFNKVMRKKEEANFRNTMNMNWLASVCANVGFITLLILK